MLLLSSCKCQNTIKDKITLGSHKNNMFYSRVGVGAGAGAGQQKTTSAPPKKKVNTIVRYGYRFTIKKIKFAR